MTADSHTGNQMPKRLRKDPIAEAIVEIRFVPKQPHAASILPGLIFSELRDTYRGVEALPMSMVPEQLRQMNPEFAYQATNRLQGTSSSVLIGERVVCASMTAPYKGWAIFKEGALKVFEVVRKSELVETIERVSAKYVNLIEAPVGSDQAALTNSQISFGKFAVTNQPFMVRAEFAKDDLTAIVNLIAQAKIVSPNGEKTGLVIDVDVVRNRGDYSDFWNRLSDHLDALHSFEKEVFFSILSGQVLQSYDPEY